MGRRALSLLILLLAAGCGNDAFLPGLPREISIETRFTDEEILIIEEAVDEANRELGTELLGHPALTYLGPYDDPDGFHVEDFDDGRAVIYVLSEDSSEYRYVADVTERGYGGYATLADVHMVYRYLPPPEATDEERMEMRRRFKRIVLHELGHFLGMSHNPDPGALMYAGPKPPDVTTYTLVDKRDFCFVYECLHEPSE